MKKQILRFSAAVLCAVLLLHTAALPAYADVPGFDTIKAGAAILMDAETGQVLYEKNGYGQMYPASITKIMTGLLAMENLNENQQLVASSTAMDTPAYGTKAGFRTGEEMTVADAMYGMMLPSGNDAANVIGEAVSGSLGDFAARMNRRARELGARGTNFTNAHGLPDPNHYTTAYDMALITRQAIQTPGFMTYFGAGSYRMGGTNLSSARTFTNTHSMLVSGSGSYNAEVLGGKTGYTDQAGYTLVTVAQRGDRTLICVILNSSSYFVDTLALLDFGFEEFSPYTYTVPWYRRTREVSTRDGGRDSGTAEFSLPETVTLLLHSSQSGAGISTDLQMPDTPSLRDDAIVGEMVFTVGRSTVEGLPTEMLRMQMQAQVTVIIPPELEFLTYFIDEEKVAEFAITAYEVTYKLLLSIPLLIVAAVVVVRLYRRIKHRNIFAKGDGYYRKVYKRSKPYVLSEK